MTVLALRHHTTPGLRQALLSADWVGAAGLEVVPAPLTATGPPRPADLTLVVVDGLHGVDAGVLEAHVLALSREAPVLLAGPTIDVLPALARQAGLRLGGWTPEHEVRLHTSPDLDPRGGELLVHDRLALVEAVDEHTCVLASASVAYHDHPVATITSDARVAALTLGSSPATWQDRQVLRLVAHLAHEATTVGADPTISVGMVGYGAIGHEHARAVAAVPGLALAAVADLAPARRAAAQQTTPDVRVSADPESLLADPDVDLLVVSTPPNTHASWAKAALDAGKHVVLEKPMALTAADCDALLAQAEEQRRLLVVYQNRRFDPDYLALRRLVRSRRIGEVFHLESFVGGYAHPCSYWHSHAPVSGGALFDWGSHVLDQVLDLVPEPIRFVTSSEHKRRWHDVTNADHVRVTLHFQDGQEAEFVYSDLAAAAKPKWLVLGTEGAVVGQWRTERVVARTPIGTLDEDVLAPADSPAALTLHDPDGSTTAVAVPPPPPQAFHRELADHLLRGLPMTVQARHSRDVVAVMEAAAASARRGGVPVEPA